MSSKDYPEEFKIKRSEAHSHAQYPQQADRFS